MSWIYALASLVTILCAVVTYTAVLFLLWRDHRTETTYKVWATLSLGLLVSLGYAWYYVTVLGQGGAVDIVLAVSWLRPLNIILFLVLSLETSIILRCIGLKQALRQRELALIRAQVTMSAGLGGQRGERE